MEFRSPSNMLHLQRRRKQNLTAVEEPELAGDEVTVRIKTPETPRNQKVAAAVAEEVLVVLAPEPPLPIPGKAAGLSLAVRPKGAENIEPFA